jgi:ribonuclease HII
LPYGVAPLGVNDSKQLSQRQRETLYAAILKSARGVGVGVASVETIESINVLRATHLAMRLALENLPAGLFPDIALIDGLPVKEFPIPQLALVKGDQRSVSIAAASIIAKVSRDQIMNALDAIYPCYGFALHKGYGVPQHLRALKERGASPAHRRTFRPVLEAEGGVMLLEGGEERGSHVVSKTRAGWRNSRSKLP